MDLIDTITDSEIFGVQGTNEVSPNRNAARAVLFDENGLVPVLFVAKKNFHKLPGGGVEEGESLLQALDRECMEEIGCKIEITGEIGIFVDIRQEKGRQTTSYCYLGKIVEKVEEPKFDKNEIKDQYELVWMKLDEAIDTFKNDKPTNYSGKFIQKRDIEILEKAKEILK